MDADRPKKPGGQVMCRPVTVKDALTSAHFCPHWGAGVDSNISTS